MRLLLGFVLQTTPNRTQQALRVATPESQIYRIDMGKVISLNVSIMVNAKGSDTHTHMVLKKHSYRNAAAALQFIYRVPYLAKFVYLLV